jgi:Flp pilus assembly pilin Flp
LVPRRRRPRVAREEWEPVLREPAPDLNTLMKHVFLRFVRDDSGQDLIEYAFLTVFVALASIVAFDVLQNAIGTAYTNWDASEQSLWDTKDINP